MSLECDILSLDFCCYCYEQFIQSSMMVTCVYKKHGFKVGDTFCFRDTSFILKLTLTHIPIDSNTLLHITSPFFLKFLIKRCETQKKKQHHLLLSKTLLFNTSNQSFSANRGLYNCVLVEGQVVSEENRTGCHHLFSNKS